MDGLSLTPAALLLLPVVLAALLWIRFLRGRRQEVMTGSLLIWRSLAELQPVNPPRRFLIDRSLVLQALALTALVAALARPEFTAVTGGRTVVLVADNGPLARFRSTDGSLLWNGVAENAKQALTFLTPADRVIFIRAAPFPKPMSPSPVTPSEARGILDSLQPALSGPDSETLFAYARNAARSANSQTVAVFSAGAAPAMAAQSGEWNCLGRKAQANAGLVAFGAVPLSVQGKEVLQGLVRVHNAAAEARELSIRGAQDGGRDWSAKLALPPNGDEVFTLDGVDAGKALRITLASDDGLLEDNTLLAEPRKAQPIRIRYHAKLPALERLFTALQAESVPADATGPADLDVYAGTPPQQLASNARAMLLVEPNSGYRFFFDIGEAPVTSPVVLRDEPSPLTANFKGGGEAGLFPVARAVEILRTGSFSSLLKDGRTQRTLAARFVDERNRPGYVLAFTPGYGSAPEALLPDELAALLLRIGREAAGHTEPFTVESAASWESRNDAPGGREMAVLDATVTSLTPGDATGSGLKALLAASEAPQKFSLRPWLVMLALLLLATEQLLTRSHRRPTTA